jgi:hypothetical protein
MPLWLVILILTTTVGGLLFAAFGMWLGFKTQQAEIGASTSDLGRAVATQQEALEAAERRIQNLEAIVTSQAWDVLGDEELSEVEKKHAVSQGRLQADILEEEGEPSDAERAARLARRV